MADFRLDLDNSKIADLALRSDGVRRHVEQEGATRAAALSADVGAENVDTFMGGQSRARYTIRRLERLQKEAEDGKLSRLLGGG